ncbi:VOC family protein [Paenibacillus sp. GYB004]|uniref:VOC family protein n=1 Tax=Paenibacillus sp. GYB004 TaxID=2994393 RepID=UPI002F964FD1
MMDPVHKNQNSDGYKPAVIPNAFKVIHGRKEAGSMKSLINQDRIVDRRAESRLEKRIGSMFIRVSDMKKAVEWYSRVFDLPYNNDYLEDRLSTVYTLHLDETEVLLDSNGEAAPSPQPLMFIRTDDIRSTLQFFKDNDIKIHKEVLENNIIIFEDPDGNRLMAIQM